MRYAIWALTAMGAMACDVNPYVTPPAPAQLVGTGDYEFDGYAPLSRRPVRVFYHVPEGVRADAPVVFVLHGANRNADDYRDAWIDAADRDGLIIVAPAFRDVFYPQFALGEVFADGERPSADTLNDPSEWAFAIIEPLFDDVVDRTPSTASTYTLFGHSAGAQFLHRFVMFQPDARFDRAFAANAGWYTLPLDPVEFPYGLGQTPLEAGPREFFRRELVILIGDQDTNPQSAGLRHTPEADAQGNHRYARAYHFLDTSTTAASEAGVAFSWTLEEVPGVGHDHVGMGAYAAARLVAGPSQP